MKFTALCREFLLSPSAPDSHLLMPKVYVLPPHFQGLLFACSGQNEEPQIEFQLPRVLCDAWHASSKKPLDIVGSQGRPFRGCAL